MMRASRQLIEIRVDDYLSCLFPLFILLFLATRQQVCTFDSTEIKKNRERVQVVRQRTVTRSLLRRDKEFSINKVK